MCLYFCASKVEYQKWFSLIRIKCGVTLLQQNNTFPTPSWRLRSNWVCITKENLSSRTTTSFFVESEKETKHPKETSPILKTKSLDVCVCHQYPCIICILVLSNILLFSLFLFPPLMPPRSLHPVTHRTCNLNKASPFYQKLLRDINIWTCRDPYPQKVNWIVA